MSGFPLREIKSPYNDEMKKMDEEILKLILQRRDRAGGVHMFPSQEQLNSWAETFSMEIPELATLIGAFNKFHGHIGLLEPEELQGVLPVMKRTLSGDCEYLFSHIMQYETHSVAKLEIRYLPETTPKNQIQMIPHLTLAVVGGDSYADSYTVSPHGSSGGGGYTSLDYSIFPRLPDDLAGLAFSLVPGGFMHWMEPRTLQVKLDKQVDF